MAKRIVTVTEYMDDLDSTPLDESQVNTIKFGWHGTSYEIDLSSKNAEKFEKVIQPYVDAARRTSRSSRGSVSKRPGTASGYNKDTLAQIRDWATKEGYEVAPRGRIKAEIIRAWEAAH